MIDYYVTVVTNADRYNFYNHLKLKEPKPMATRTTLVKLRPTQQQAEYLDLLLSSISCRAADVLQVMLSLNNDSIDVREQDVVHSIGLNFQNYTNAKVEGLDEMAKGLYRLLLKNPHASRTVRGPFVNNNCKTGQKSQGQLEQQLKRMIEAGVLPVALPKWEGKANYEYAAFHMALIALKSWDDRDCAARIAYSNKSTVFQKIDTEVSGDPNKVVFEAWLEKHELYLTRKVVKKFRRFGWETRLRNYNFDDLKAVNSEAEYWLRFFAWKVQQRELYGLDGASGMRPRAAFTFPNLENSPRAVHFGKNYEPFRLKYDGRRFTLSFADQVIGAVPTRYYQNLEVEDCCQGQAILYKFRYRRGNFSPLNEDVVGELKEITIMKRNGNYYFSVPLAIDVPKPDEKADKLVEVFHSDTLKVKNWPAGVKVMGVDLGISTPASCCVTESVSDGEYRLHGNVAIGVVKNQEYYRSLCNFDERLKSAHEAIDVLKDKINGLAPFSENWIKMCEPMAERVEELCQVMRQLRRPEHRVRSAGVSVEQVKFIFVYKRYISLLQRWTYFGTKPTAKRVSRRGFERHYRRLNNLKLDFRKKVACEIIRTARKNGVGVVVIEDLSHFLPDQENKTGCNELLMLWGSGQIGKWISHFAEQYGILVEFVDPKYTSQIDPLTGEFGLRGKFNKKVLYVRRGGKIVEIDADMAAAENLAAYLHSRGTNIPHLKGRVVEGGYALWGDTKQFFAVKKLFGAEFIVIRGGLPVKVTKNKALSMTTGKEVDLYRYADGWQLCDTHDERKDVLKKECTKKSA